MKIILNKTFATYFLSLACALGLITIVYAGTPEKTVAYLAYTEGFWQVWVMDAEGKNSKQVTQSPYDKSRVSWFPDGRHLLANGNQGKLVKVSISSGNETMFQVDPAGMNDATLSPNGKHIAFSLSTAGSIDDNNIWLVKADGSDPKRIANMKGLQHEPVWSPDSQWIYFLSGKGGQVHDIWRLSVSKHQTEQLTTGQLYHFDVAISSKGQLAFSSNRSGNYEIWMQEPKGKAVKLTDHPALDAHPAWSPDGKTIIFESTRGGIVNLWKMNLEDKKLVSITQTKTGARAPVWKGR